MRLLMVLLLLRCPVPGPAPADAAVVTRVLVLLLLFLLLPQLSAAATTLAGHATVVEEHHNPCTIAMRQHYNKQGGTVHCKQERSRRSGDTGCCTL